MEEEEVVMMVWAYGEYGCYVAGKSVNGRAQDNSIPNESFMCAVIV